MSLIAFTVAVGDFFQHKTITFEVKPFIFNPLKMGCMAQTHSEGV